jgi:chorismate--pyruvate lyase
MNAHPEQRVSEVLLDRGSLSRRLSELSHGEFAVMPLQEQHSLLRDDECLALNLPSGSRGWIREVYLTGYGKPWVYARTVMPESILQENGLNMESLGSRPLGELLFGADHFCRGALEVFRYMKFDRGARLIEPLWMRRSNFSRGSLMLCVSEMFLPGFWAARAQGTA